MSIADFGSFNAQGLGLAVDAFTTGALGVDGLVERTATIQGDPHEAASFHVDVFNTAFAFGKLRMVAALAGGLGKEQGTAIALRPVAVGVGELVSGMHAQAARAERHPVGIALIDGMGVLVLGNSGDAPAEGTGLVDVPGIKGGIGGDMRWKLGEGDHGLVKEGEGVADVSGIEGLGIFSQHDVTIVRSGGSGDSGAITPQVFFFYFLGAISLFLIVAAFDAYSAVRVASGLLVFTEAIEQGNARIVFFDPGIDVLDIEGDRFARSEERRVG